MESTGNKAMIGAVAVAAVLLIGVAVFAVQSNEGLQQTLAEIAPGVESNTREVVVPAGTALTVRLETELSTKESEVGDEFRATVTSPVMIGGESAIPTGSTIQGHVIVSEEPGKASGRGNLQLSYDEIEIAGSGYAMETKSRVYESESGAGKDAALIGGGAVAGGIIGGVIGGGADDAAKGAAVGGAAGTAASLMTRGPQIHFEPGTLLTFQLDHDLVVEVPRKKMTS